MAYDAELEWRYGKAAPLYCSISATCATSIGDSGATVTGQPGGTITIYDSGANVMDGFNAVAVTGYDLGALQTVRFWFMLATKSLPGPGDYVAVFNCQALGSDGIARTPEQAIQLTVMPVVETIATYDETQLTTNLLYATRFAAADTNPGNPDFSDAELNYCLSVTNNNPLLAAARALRIAAGDNARTAIITKKGTRGNDESQVYTAMIEAAQSLESRAITPAVTDEDIRPIFTIGRDSKWGRGGSMKNW